MPTIIGLTGPKGSGKDTVGQFIKELYPHHFVRTMAFADPIKKVIQYIFNLDPTNINHYDLFKRDAIYYQLPGHPQQIVQGRHIVREIGMLMRKYDEKQFTDYVEREIMTNNTKNSIDVITDLRFDNEYLMLRDLGARIIKIHRPNYHYDGHITERGFDDALVDYVLYNDEDMPTLRKKVQDTMDNIMKEKQ